MKTFLIQRNVPGAGKSSAEQCRDIAVRSCAVLDQMGDDIQWQQSYVTADNLWCVYKAQDEELIREHARRGNFPCNAIFEIVNVISPKTAQVPA